MPSFGEGSLELSRAAVSAAPRRLAGGRGAAASSDKAEQEGADRMLKPVLAASTCKEADSLSSELLERATGQVYSEDIHLA